MQERLEDFYGYEASGSDMGFYDDVDECVEESLEWEEEAYEECLEDEDEEDCQEMIDKWREAIMKMLTREGCEDIYGARCDYLEPTSETKKYASKQEIEDMEEAYEECLEDLEDLCGPLPKKF
jgi:hypothetical protein